MNRASLTTPVALGRVKMPPVTLRPFNVQVAELFKIEGGKIHRIEGVELTLPYMQPDPWARR